MRYFLSAYPAARILSCAVCGILAAIFLSVPPTVWLVIWMASCVLVVLMLAFDWRRLPAGRPSTISALCYLGFLFSAFALHAACSFRFVPSPSLFSWVGRDVILSGEVDGRPVSGRGGASMQLHVMEVFDAGTTTKVDDRANIVVRLPASGGFELQEGDYVRFKGRLSLIAGASNRGEYDPRLQNRFRKIHVQLFCAGPWCMLREAPGRGFSPFRVIINPVRSYLACSIDRRFPPGRERQFVKSMILGERDMLPEELYDAFRRTGTAHVIAVSGLHVALLAYAVNLCLQRLKVTTAGRWASMAILISVIALYSFVTGNAPSIQRAAIMSGMMIAGGTLGRKSFPVNSLAASDLIILLLDPLDLFNPGFVMTNGAVLGILTIHGRLSGIVPKGKKRFQRLTHLIWESFSVSISAMIGVSPIIALYFGTFSPSGIVANLPVVLFSNLAMYATLPLFLFHGFAGPLASLFGICAWLFAKLTLFFTLLFSRMPMASVEVGADIVDVAVFYAALAVTVHALGRKAWGRAAIAVLFGLNLMLWHEMTRPIQKPPGMLTVNLGREMALLFSSGSETVLVDAGRRPGTWDRIRRQTDAWGLAPPVAAVGFYSPDSVIKALPVSRRPDSSGRLVLRSVVVSRLEDKVLRIDSRGRSMLLVSGMARLAKTNGERCEVILWVYRFTGKQWRELDAWIAAARPRRMLLVPGPFMSASQRALLFRFASVRKGVEVRSKSAQTSWL
ncbi:MAG TPA: ComEC/Rec2 family competence protein [Chlorobaculum sp.]|nr:ComEC/Rec2 family competence protein [Chlorobaculum sp.]